LGDLEEEVLAGAEPEAIGNKQYLSNFTSNMKKSSITVILALLCFFAYAQDIPDQPDFSYPIGDYAGILTSEQKEELSKKLKDYEDSSSTYIHIITVKTLDHKEVGAFTRELFNRWQMHAKGKCILLVADLKEHRYGIAESAELENKIPDEAAEMLEDKFIKPNFREKRYYKGLEDATNCIIGLISGTYTLDQLKTENNSSVFVLIVCMFLSLFFVVPFIQFKSFNNAHIGTKKKDFVSTIMFMNSFGAGSKSGYDDFSKSNGTFVGRGFGGFGSGGGGAAGSW